MKNFNRVFVGLTLAFGFIALSSLANATVGVRSPKSAFTLTYTTVITSVTPFTVLESTSGIEKPGAVYQVILATGASTEFIVMFDTTTSLGLTVNQNTGPFVGPRLYYSSSTQNTVITFDPPIRFYKGLQVIDSAVTGQASIIWEPGAGLSGN